MSLQLYFSIFFLCITLAPVKAQLKPTIIGDAIDQGDNCFIITPDEEFKIGGVWYNNPIDFDSDFTIYYQNNFGSKDANGADGMALVFKGDATPVLGGNGGNLAYSTIAPSLIVEFDTFLSTDLGDPAADHISIMRDGNPNHSNTATNLSGPIQASATSLNIEDGNAHEVRIEWDAGTNTFQVFFDCILRLSLNQDVKNTIFSGDDSVFFGFVGCTGGLSNLQQVCFNSISFVDNLQLDDVVICEGEAIQVDATLPSGNTYNWTPTNGVSDTGSPSPLLSPIITTTYTVTISDVCGETITEEITVTVVPLSNEPVFDPIPPICVGDTLNELPTTSNDGIMGTWSPDLNNTMTTTYTFTPFADQCALETTLTIEVTLATTPTFNEVPSVCPGDFIAPLPTTSTNGFTGTWSPAINNQATTVYTFNPDADQGCITTTTLQIIIREPIIPTFDPINPICEGGTLDDLPTISNEGIRGTWSPALNNLTTTTYSFDANPNQCASDIATIQIEIIPISEISIEVELTAAPFSSNQTAIVNVTGGTGLYEFQIDNGAWVAENTFSNLVGCQEYEIRAREISGCSNTAVERLRVLQFPDFFTPNGDGINDFWNIDCLKDQSAAVIVIFDRYGRILRYVKPSLSGWDGTYNGREMPASDYWFKIEYFDNKGVTKIFRSNFTLIR